MDSRVYDLLYSKAPLCEGNAKNERWVGGCCWVGVGRGGVKSCNYRVVIRYNGTYNGTYFFLLSCASSGHGHVDEAMNLKK